MTEDLYKKLAIAGLSGSQAGKLCAKIFQEVEAKAIKLSKTTCYSKEEIINSSINIAKTTTLNLSEAFNIVENKIKNES